MTKADRQNKIREFVEEFYIQNRYPPTVREILQGVGVKSTATVFDDVVELISQGSLDKVGGNILPIFSPEYIERLVASFTIM